jgi:hypothetical protein
VVSDARREQPIGVIMIAAGILAAVLALLVGPRLSFAGAQACSVTGPSGASGGTGPTGGCGPTGYPLYVPVARAGGASDQALGPIDRHEGGGGSAFPMGMAALAGTALVVQVGIAVAVKRRRASSGTPRA